MHAIWQCRRVVTHLKLYCANKFRIVENICLVTDHPRLPCLPECVGKFIKLDLYTGDQIIDVSYNVSKLVQ